MHILIEGISGVGKTALAKKLAARLDWRYLHGLYGAHNKNHIHPLTSLVFGHSTGVHNDVKSKIAARIRELMFLTEDPTLTSNVIVDRWYPSAYVYQGDISGDKAIFHASFLVVPDSPFDHETLLYRTFFENNSKQYGYKGEIPSSGVINSPQLVIDKICEEIGYQLKDSPICEAVGS